jgi:hypothetical protein
MEFLMGGRDCNLRTELNCARKESCDLLRPAKRSGISAPSYLRSLARVGMAEFRGAGDAPKGAATAVVEAMEVYLPLDDLINLDEERARLAKEIAKMEDEIGRVQKKLGNSDFVAKAKEAVIQKERDKVAQFDEKFARCARAWPRSTTSKREGINSWISCQPTDRKVDPRCPGRRYRRRRSGDHGDDLSGGPGKGLFRAKRDGVVAGGCCSTGFYFIDHRVEVRLLVNDGAA